MILAGILALAVFPGRFVEQSVPTAKSVLIETAVVFPYLSPRDRAVEEVLAACLMQGTSDYTKEDLRGATVYAGEPLKCVATADCLRITVGVRKADWKTGLRIVHSLLTNPLLSDEAIENAKDTLPFVNRSPWRSALDPVILKYDQVRKRDVIDFIARNLVPEATSIVISGPFNPGDPRTFWFDEVSGWTNSHLTQFPPDRRSDRITRRPELPVSILRWDGPELPLKGGIAVPMLAAFALGAGKESAAFRVLREKERLSYRQEAMLAPFGEGVRLQLVAAFRPQTDESGLADRVKADMLEDIGRWNEDTRLRALALAKAAFERGAMPVPFALTPEGVLNSEDRHFLNAYWGMKTGEAWNTRSFVQSLEAVSLEDLKQCASGLFTQGSAAQSQDAD